jgi:hypothetical protein
MRNSITVDKRRYHDYALFVRPTAGSTRGFSPARLRCSGHPFAKSELLYGLDGRRFLGEGFSGMLSSTMTLFGDRPAEDTS